MILFFGQIPGVHAAQAGLWQGECLRGFTSGRALCAPVQVSCITLPCILIRWPLSRISAKFQIQIRTKVFHVNIYNWSFYLSKNTTSTVYILFYITMKDFQAPGEAPSFRRIHIMEWLNFFSDDHFGLVGLISDPDPRIHMNPNPIRNKILKSGISSERRS